MSNEYVTKQDLSAALADTQRRVVEELTEKIRDAQTEILRAFYSWARPVEARLKPVEEHSQGLAWLDEQVAELERRNLTGGKQ